VKKVEHCRLETHPQFFDFFVEGCQFKPVEPSVVGIEQTAKARWREGKREEAST
jgi:hypothetical protein